MAKRIVSVASQTPTATADTTALASGTYPFAIQGTSGTQKTNILEVYLGGQAGASSPSIMLLSRDSTIAATVGATTTTDAALDASNSALSSPVVTGNTWTTAPQRSASLHLLNLSFNAFGGVVRWVAAPGEEISIVGNTASLGEVSLSAFTGGTPGLLGAHAVYETL